MSPTVRAKFRVSSVEARAWNGSKKPDHWSITMEPVTRDSDDPDSENTSFWEATPSGKLEIQTTNKDAADRFTPGREYYLDFTPADEGE